MTREEATPSVSITEVIENLEQMLYQESTSLSKRFTTKEIETLNTAINDLQFLNKVSLDLASENDELEEKLKQEPRKGHWITKPHVYGVAFCSECDFELKTNDTNFCPNCGADMKEGEE